MFEMLQLLFVLTRITTPIQIPVSAGFWVVHEHINITLKATASGWNSYGAASFSF